MPYFLTSHISCHIFVSGYGDTIVASNPFDDSPPQMASSHVNMNSMNNMSNMNSMNNMNHIQQHMRHMPCSPQHMMHMGGPSPCQMGGSPLNCGPPMGSPMSSGPMSCVGGPGGMNCGPGMGSPIGPNRSPLMCPPGSGMMSCGPPASSPMNPSVGSPLMGSMSGPPSGKISLFYFFIHYYFIPKFPLVLLNDLQGASACI